MNSEIKNSEIKLEIFDQLDTTLTIARERLALEENFAILALEQTNAVGQQGRKWFSPKGNLSLSLVLSTYTFCELGELALLFATSIYKTVKTLIDESISENLRYKYPNDIYLYSKKLAGILVEVHQGRMIASMGLNLQNAPEEFISLKDYVIDKNKLNPIVFFHLFWQQHQRDLGIIAKEGMEYVYKDWKGNLL